MGRSFYEYPNKKGIYLAEILDPVTGVRVCTRSTGTKSRDDALAWLPYGLYTGFLCERRDLNPYAWGTRY